MAQNKSLFDRLKTLFSTNVVVRNVGGKKLKVVDTARYQGDGNPHTSKVIDRYGRLHGTKGTPISVYNQYNSFSATKIDLYILIMRQWTPMPLYHQHLTYMQMKAL